MAMEGCVSLPLIQGWDHEHRHLAVVGCIVRFAAEGSASARPDPTRRKV
jgi:hypothetical protein